MNLYIPLFLIYVIFSFDFSSPPISGDFNGDGALDVNDLDLLTSEIGAGTNNPSFDLTGDVIVDLADRNEWLSIAGSMNLDCMATYLLGDLNLDGFVDFSDLVVLTSNLQSSSYLWSQGDINADGIIDALDQNLLEINLLSSSCDVARGACCLPDGQCIIDTEGNCINALGRYQGDGTDCESVGCAPIPTFSQWGIIALSVIMLIIGLVFMKQRKVVFR